MLVQTFLGIFFGQNPFSAILRLKKRKKKSSYGHLFRERGGGKTLVPGPQKNNFFCGFPYDKIKKCFKKSILFFIKNKNKHL